jgi:hypothetical protein
MKTVLLTRSEIIDQYHISKYRIRKAVADGALTQYDGSVAGVRELYFRTEVEAWIDTLPASAKLDTPDENELTNPPNPPTI